MNPLNLLSNRFNSQPNSDRESPLTRTESTSSTDNSTVNASLNLSTPTQPFPSLPLLFDPNLNQMFFNFVQMCQRRDLSSGLFDNQNHISLPSIWQPVHPLPLINRQLLDHSVETQDDRNETVESASENDLSYLEMGRPVQGVKRQYTDSTLNYAISQIKSGQMGTRRASVKYGIPRSTLRNKMNKSREVPTRLLPQLVETSPEEEIQIENSVESQLVPPTKNEPSTAEHQQTMSNMSLFVQFVNSLQNSSPPLFPFPIQSLNGSFGQQEQKPARGKRGQYRRYDKEALQKAVEEVRAGMSVHRAGTLYGVPHSTLEYKVKDRSRKGQQQRLEAQLRKEQEELAQHVDPSLDIDCCPKLSPANTPANTPSCSTN